MNELQFIRFKAFKYRKKNMAHLVGYMVAGNHVAPNTFADGITCCMVG
jgi:hypothetical protein